MDDLKRLFEQNPYLKAEGRRIVTRLAQDAIKQGADPALFRAEVNRKATSWERFVAKIREARKALVQETPCSKSTN